MNDAGVRVLIVDDQLPFREAAKVVFQLLDQFDVVGEATSGDDARALVESLRPDLVLMDINLPGISGVDATRHITAAHPDTVVILVSTYEVNALPRGASSCGAPRVCAQGALGRRPHRAALGRPQECALAHCLGAENPPQCAGGHGVRDERVSVASWA